MPFVASLAPSERARALGAPVEVELQASSLGEITHRGWRGKPVFVLRRSQDMLDALARHDELLADPRFAPIDAARADRATPCAPYGRSMAVMEAVCTHLGCIPSFRPTPGSAGHRRAWPGGFYCPCHGSKFDFAGRVFKNVPAPTNLTVPPSPLRLRYHAAHRRRCEDLIFQRPGELTMQTLSFDVSGMTCGGCTGSVQRALSKIDGVSHAEVTLHPASPPW